ncbi:DUF4136 domain-containing protein [Paludibaculum fermentans]|uniref:DUF4136 domain-containing protein n=1 Tax=Paludibaculum fermentans TaxID=1473598 RepID=UPI003EC143D0
MKRITFAGLVCLGMLAAAQDIHFDYDRTASFGAYRTYRWVDAPSGGAENPLMDQNIKRAVDSQLALKGLRSVETGGDLLVSYQVGIEKEKQLNAFGTGPRWNGSGRVTTSTIENGKLAVAFVDAARNQLVWQGALEKTLDIKKDPEKNFRNLEKAVAKLLSNYPPSSGK